MNDGFVIDLIETVELLGVSSKRAILKKLALEHTETARLTYDKYGFRALLPNGVETPREEVKRLKEEKREEAKREKREQQREKEEEARGLERQKQIQREQEEMLKREEYLLKLEKRKKFFNPIIEVFDRGITKLLWIAIILFIIIIAYVVSVNV